MGDWYTYRLFIKADTFLRDAIEEIPGAKLARNMEEVTVGENAAWLVQDILNTCQIGYTVSRRESSAAKARIDASREALIERLEKTGRVRSGTIEWCFDHQIEGVSERSGKDGNLFLWGCATGKTIGAALWSVLEEDSLSVCVVPAAVRKQFGREVDRVLLNGKARVILPGKKWEEDDLVNEIKNGVTHIVVAAEALAHHGPTIRAVLRKFPKKRKNLVIDELHKLKSRKRFVRVASKTQDGKFDFHKRGNIVSNAYDLTRMIPRRLGLTATFVDKDLSDCWGQLDLIEPGQWGHFWRGYNDEPEDSANYGRAPTGFAKRYCDGRPGLWGGIEAKGRSNLDELVQRLSFVAHFVDGESVKDKLPPVRREVVYISPEEQVKATGFDREIKEAMAKGASFLAEILVAEAAARKRKWVLDRMEPNLEANHKVIVMTGRHKDCAKLAAEVKKRFDCQVWDAPGSLSPSQRDVIKQEYINHPGPCVLVCTADAWGTGVDGLQRGTSLLIQAMLPWKLSLIEQREGRVNRPGQTTPCVIVYPICERSYDEKIASTLLARLPAVAAINAGDNATEFGKDLKGDETKLLDSIMEKITAEHVDLFADWQD